MPGGINQQKIYINHLGFLCNAKKTVLVETGSASRFGVQDMGQVAAETLGQYENWKTVFHGELKPVNTEMGNYLSGDFSRLTHPGVYRIVLPEGLGHSFQFVISDGVFHLLPRIFLDFIHNWRSGDFSNFWRGPSHLDDGIRSDNGRFLDVSGGWYDAGDTRKWMTMSNLPALGLMDMYERQKFNWNFFSEEKVTDNDLVTETIWGIKFILKMQDQESGMFFEEIGAGGQNRFQPGMSWWYENHSGCYADNSQNYFTDNLTNSGDERTIRVEYNPLVQYINQYILLRAAFILPKFDLDLSARCLKSALKNLQYVNRVKEKDPMHEWTSVRSWRLGCMNLLYRNGTIPEKDLNRSVNEVLGLQDPATGFWHMETSRKDMYRGIQHSAQPMISLCQYLELFPSGNKSPEIFAALTSSAEKYISWAVNTNPFGILPYGTWYSPPTPTDRYRKFTNNLFFRFFMPDHSPQKINHGLAGHWMSWAHALAWMGSILKDQTLTDLAWNQVYWAIGNNPLQVSLISGIGYNNPMPHSRFLGTFPGGFCVGPRGNEKDEIVIDQERRAEWNSTEYWNTPLANLLMALSVLLPVKPDHTKLLGYKKYGNH